MTGLVMWTKISEYTLGTSTKKSTLTIRAVHRQLPTSIAGAARVEMEGAKLNRLEVETLGRSIWPGK
jgi:hypothetical protein